MLVRGVVAFIREALAGLRRDMRHIAVGVCLFLHAGNWPTRIVAFTALILLLPCLVILSPYALARCGSFRRFRRK